VRLFVVLTLIVACRPPMAVVEPQRVEPVIPVPAIDEVMFRHGPALEPRSPLDNVAAAAAQSAADGHVVSARVVREAMAANLGSGMWPHVLTGWGSDAEIAAQLDTAIAELRATADIAELGVARANGAAGRVGVVIAMPDPKLPLVIDRSESPRITMAWRWSDAPAAFAVTSTTSRRLEATLVAQNLDLAVDCARPAAIEIRAGARVVATVVDACGEYADANPPASIDFGPPAHTRVEIEQRLFELVNRERVAHDRPPLAWDPEAQRFARNHAADMARMHHVGHEAPDGSSLHQRVELASFRSSTTRENVGHAWGPGEVHVAFMASPGHRENLLAFDIDRGAVGIASDPADPTAFYITEFFRAR